MLHSKDLESLNVDAEPFDQRINDVLSLPWIVTYANAQESLWLGICLATGYLVLIDDVETIDDITSVIIHNIGEYIEEYPLAHYSFHFKPFVLNSDKSSVEIYSRLHEGLQGIKGIDDMEEIHNVIDLLNEKEFSIGGNTFRPDFTMLEIFKGLNDDFEHYLRNTSSFRVLVNHLRGNTPWLENPNPKKR